VAYANLLHVDICAKNLSKASGVFEVAKRHRIETDAIYCIGDSFNDQTMIEFAGLGVAMGNAHEDIKAIANHVTDTNMNDGVAKVVEEFIFRKPVMV